MLILQPIDPIYLVVANINAFGIPGDTVFTQQVNNIERHPYKIPVYMQTPKRITTVSKLFLKYRTIFAHCVIAAVGINKIHQPLCIASTISVHKLQQPRSMPQPQKMQRLCFPGFNTP